MIRVLRTIRTVILVAIALVVLAAVGLFGWWTAIAPDCRSIWGNPDARCIAADCRGLTAVLDARCPHRRRPLNSLAPAQRPLPSGGPASWSAAWTMAAAAFRRSWAADCSTVRSLRVGDPDAMAEGFDRLPCQQPHSRSERSLRPLACHAVSAAPPPQVRRGGPLSRPLGVTVSVRWIPLVPAACGTRVARPERTTCPTRARSAPPSSAADQDRRARSATSSTMRASPMPTIQASLARGMPC